MTTPTTQQTAAREFVAFWTGKGYEKGQIQPFSMSLSKFGWTVYCTTNRDVQVYCGTNLVNLATGNP